MNVVILSCLAFVLLAACQSKHDEVQKAGNPIFEGWYADPEGAVFGDKYWMYPTYSDIYSRQVFMDCFSSPDLINWTKHERIIDTAAIQWADSALWTPAIIEKNDQYFLFFAANDIQNNQ